MIFALVGNQNCGKTTLFNALTGSNQHVGNFPGVTVDQKMGEMRDEKGCSSRRPAGHLLSASVCAEDIVSRDLSSTRGGRHHQHRGRYYQNIERNLYLTLPKGSRLRVPTVLAR